MPSTSSSSSIRQPIVYLMARPMISVSTPDQAIATSATERLVDRASRSRRRRRAVDAAGTVGRGEDADQHGADDAADQVDADDVERVVVAELVLQAHGPGADPAGDGADGDGADRGHRTTGRGDRDQTGDDAGRSAQRGGLAVQESAR